MEALIAQQKADRGNPSEVSDEISLGTEESSLRPDEISVAGGMKAHSVVAKVSVVEGPSNKRSQLPKEGGALLSDKETRAGHSTAKQAHVKESSPREISSESSPSGISSRRCAVSPETTLGELFPQLDWEHKKEHYKRTKDSTRTEQVRVAVELLAQQRLQPNPNS
jgi:hypothetical protein